MMPSLCSLFFPLTIGLGELWFSQWLSSKESACNAGDAGWIPGSGRWLGGGNGNLHQYSCLENPMDREAWWATVHRAAKNQTWLKHLSMHMHLPRLKDIKIKHIKPITRGRNTGNILLQQLTSITVKNFSVTAKWIIKYCNNLLQGHL